MHLTRAPFLSLTAAIAVATLAGCGSSETEEMPQIITVVEHAETDVVEDLGETGDSAGDLLTFANPLFDADNKEQIGTNQGYCIRVVAGKAWECFWTAFLAEGQITVEGPFFDTSDSVLAITGGTEAYSDASGQMKLHFRNPAGTEFDFVYELE